MKKITLLFALFLSIGFTAQSQITGCGQFCVLGITIDTTVVASHKLHVTIYDGNDSTTFVNYPIVRVTNSTGDTVANISGQFFLFGQEGGDTVIHIIPTTLANLPVGFTGTVYLTDGSLGGTCTFSYPMTCTAGINELTSANSLHVYPNPATTSIELKFGEVNNKQVQINIYDATGNLVKTYTTMHNELTIDRDGLVNGIYFITVDIDHTRLTKRLVIQ